MFFYKKMKRYCELFNLARSWNKKENRMPQFYSIGASYCYTFVKLIYNIEIEKC